MHFPAFDEFYQRFLLLLPFVANFRSSRFDYDTPEKWQERFPQCGGTDQSPIAISTRKVIPIDLPPLELGLYDEIFDHFVTIINNGHTVEFQVPTTKYGERPYVTGGLMQDCFVAENVHFHWGSSTSKGSEHVLNGQRYDLEMHIVHRNIKYLTVEEARDHSDGLAVLAVLFKVLRKAPAFYQPGLTEVFGSLLHLGNPNSTYHVPVPTLGSLLSNLDRGNFYTYHGSLTTPPCSPVVLWHVFAEVLPISNQELPKFWQLRDERGQPQLNNFRPLQAAENRLIFHRQPLLRQHHLQSLQLPELVWL
ncbi:hypothetical protein KR009_007537 [Drosophila setifemur]|nr:hypothetical protein KR009_007537 [Drosophila setifemur]